MARRNRGTYNNHPTQRFKFVAKSKDCGHKWVETQFINYIKCLYCGVYKNSSIRERN